MCMGSNAVNILGLEDESDPADPLSVSSLSVMIPADVLQNAVYHVRSVAWSGDEIFNVCILADSDMVLGP